MQQSFIIKSEDDIDKLLFKVVWNIREFGTEPTREDVVRYIKSYAPEHYYKFVIWERKQKLERILNDD